jgi:hypothetical protein
MKKKERLNPGVDVAKQTNGKATSMIVRLRKKIIKLKIDKNET